MEPRHRILRAVARHLAPRGAAADGDGTTAALLDIDTSHAPSLERHGSRDPVPPEIERITPAMSNLELRRQFEEEGFVHIKGLFSPAEARQMERELAHFIDDVLPTSSVGAYYHDEADPSTVFQIDTMADEPYFDTMMNGGRGESKVNDVVEVLFGERAVGLVHFFNRIPGEEGSHDTPPHQDAAYSSQLCTAWVAVDPADEVRPAARHPPPSAPTRRTGSGTRRSMSWSVCAYRY